MDLEALYARYMASSRRRPKHGMKAYWNDLVAQALAYAIGIEEVPPSEKEFARLTEYYGGAMMVASQQEVDAFITHAVEVLVKNPPTQANEAPSLEDVGLPSEIQRALSRRGVNDLVGLFTNDYSLTDRQMGILKEAIGKHLERGNVRDASLEEVDLTEPEAVTG